MSAPPPLDLVPEVDGVTAAPPQRTRLRTRILRPVLLALALGLAALLLWSQTSARDTDPLSARNPRPDGALATAEILRDRGVDVQVAPDLATVLTLAGPGTTVLVTQSRALAPDAAEQLAGTGADLVWLAPTSVVLRAIDAPLLSSGGGATDPVTASCPDPDAQAANRIGEFRGAVEVDPEATGEEATTLCFTDPGGGSAYGVWEQGTFTLRVVSDGSLMSNARLDEDGHAALVLRALGAHETLVWFTPTSPVDAVDLDAVPPPAALSPTWLYRLGWVAAFAVLVLALALGRNLGAVIPEPLPVVVRAAETVRGRGALYRRYGSTAHAGAGLRAGAAARLARRLGLPRSTHRTDLVAAVAAAGGRDEAWVRDALYGPPPSSAAQLTQLATDLDTLESEVHRT